MTEHSDSASVGTDPHPLRDPGQPPVFGFRPPAQYVTAARERLQALPGWSVAAYLEACLRWLGEEPRTAIAAATPWAEPRVQHERLAAVLRNRISSGKIVDRMPAAAKIAEHYRVSLHTVNEALALLADEGLIVSRGPHRGYDVVAAPRRARRQRVTPLPRTTV